MPKKTFEQVKKSGNEAIIQLKGNQKKLKSNCEKIVLEGKKLSEFRIKNTGRNREETRITTKYKFEILR